MAASSQTAASARVPIALSISSTLSATSSPSPTSTGIPITPPISPTLIIRPSASRLARHRPGPGHHLCLHPKRQCRLPAAVSPARSLHHRPVPPPVQGVVTVTPLTIFSSTYLNTSPAGGSYMPQREVRRHDKPVGRADIEEREDVGVCRGRGAAVEGRGGLEGEVGGGDLVGRGLRGGCLAARRGPGEETEMARKTVGEEEEEDSWGGRRGKWLLEADVEMVGVGGVLVVTNAEDGQWRCLGADVKDDNTRACWSGPPTMIFSGMISKIYFILSKKPHRPAT